VTSTSFGFSLTSLLSKS